MFGCSSISIPLRLFKFPKLPFSSSSSPSSLFFSKSVSFQPSPPIKVPPFSLPTSSSSSSSSSPSLQPLDDLPPKLQDIISLFQSVPDPKSKYQQLLFYGKNLKPLDAHFKTRENKVEGCVSQVWVRAYLDAHQNVVFEADSDSVLTKGLAALLVQGLSGRPVEEIVRVSPDFVVLLGLQQSLTPSRNNGFLNMLKLMQKKAVEAVLEAEKGRDGGEPRKGLGSGDEGGIFEVQGSGSGLNLDDNGSVGMEEEEEVNGIFGLGRRGMRIKEVLERELRPLQLEVEDISYQHAGHAGVKGSGDGETHFNVKVVSTDFEGKSLVKRHRLIYGLLQEELQSGLHALSIVAKTPSEAEDT